MTEQEWLAANDPATMLRMFAGRRNDRKLRLFAVSCCRRVVCLRDDERAQWALAVAEQFADGLARKPQRRNAHDSVAFGPDRRPVVSNALTKVAFEAASRASESAASRVAQTEVQRHPEPASTPEIYKQAAIRRAERAKERAVQATLVRDIFGNPFRPAAVEPSWLTSTVLAIAQGIYQEGAFDRMPILADALQDAGCDNDDVLTHCRDPQQPHVRGCWVVDHLLGKE